MVDKFDIDDVKHMFAKRYDEIVGFHRVSLIGAAKAFEWAWENFSTFAALPFGSDDGDVDSAVYTEFGGHLNDFRRHLGIMVLSRAVSLAEYTLAKAAASLFADPERLVFQGGKVWKRDLAVSFYRSALVQRFDLDANGLNYFQALRDYYAHAYGIFADGKPTNLEENLLKLVGDLEPTDEEEERGYTDGVRLVVSGDGWNGWDSKEGFLPVVELSSLATARLLSSLRQVVERGLDAAEGGLLPLEELSRSKFCRVAVKIAERNARPFSNS
jgi:hypothetical protein